MRMTSPRHIALCKHARLLGAAMLVGLAWPPAPSQAQAPAASRPAGRAKAPVTVNFVNADIEAVTRAIAAMIERQIAVDPRVKGTITVYSEQPQSVQEAFQGYLSALRGLGFAVVDNGGLLKVVPEADAKLQTSTVSVGEVATRGDQVITQIFTLRYENPNNLVAVLRPLISANNTINANPASNSLIITDYAENLQRIAKIIAALDQPAATEIEIVPLQHVVASDIAQLVQRLAEGTGISVPGVAAVGSTAVLAEPRSNSLLIRAPNAARLAVIKATIAKLDRPSATSAGGGMWVVHLKNADAVRLATVLRAAFPGSGSGGASGATTGSTPTFTPAQQPSPGSPLTPGNTQSPQSTAPVTGAAQVSTGGFIQADPATNSLIITAAEPLYRQVRGMIDQLDTRRAQVYIESMIVEVSGGDAADFGFQWQGLLGQSGDKTGLVAGTNFTPSSGKGNLLTITGAQATGAASSISLGEGLNIGLLRSYGGTIALASLARLLQSQASTNIVSTPNLVTLDNEEAKIVVGENVPFITGQFTNTGTATTSPFQTIERKDVGITLRIRPQIGEGGTVRMTIFQEQSSVKTDVTAGTSNAGPATTKRSIESNLVVDDGQIIVLGGLIEDRFITNQSKVPLLGDLPLVGGLFRSESRERKRTNLMVFLRPVVMRDADSANKFSTDRYEMMRGQQKEAQPSQSTVMPINEAPVMPPMRAPSTPAPAEPSPSASAPARP